VFYASFVETVHLVESAEVAEAAKLFENVFRAVNIALVNELAQIARAQGLDPQAVLAAAATKPFGFMPFQPGPGTGGQCIPVDPCYYTHAARAAGVPAALVEEAIRINRERPQAVVDALEGLLGSLRGRVVGVLGVAYKPEVDVISESPGVEILRRLCERGARVQYSDPWVHELPELGLESVPTDTPCEAWILVTDHAAFDYAGLARSGLPILDTRGAFARRGLKADEIHPL
jgi:UDP-N-acetyl-D-glucosamine dehydrogenase